MAGIEDMGGRRRVVYGPINFCSALPSCFELSLLKKIKIIKSYLLLIYSWNIVNEMGNSKVQKNFYSLEASNYEEKIQAHPPQNSG